MAGEIRASEAATMLRSHPNIKTYPTNIRDELSNSVLENIANRLSQQSNGLIKYTVTPTTKPK